MNKREKAARAKLAEFDIHVSKRGGSPSQNDASEYGGFPHTSKSTSLRNLKDAINTFRKGR